MQSQTRRTLVIMSAVAALMVAAPIAVATSDTSSSESTLSGRPSFKVPFECGQRWLGSNWNGHSPAHSIDWNHYDEGGGTDDFGRRVFASAGGTVLASYYSTGDGYGNTIVIGHGDGWRTRYAHLKTRDVQRGASVKAGQRIGHVGKSSEIYDLSPHLHYEQIHDGQVVVSRIQGVTWSDYTKRYQVSRNSCD
jgi:hypothetical protein